MKFVRIQSSIDISVTAGLQGKDLTRKDSDIPDRLKVSPEWPKLTMFIHKGTGNYPAEIAEWNTVKCLAKDKVLTIGEIVDESETTEEEIKSANTLKRNIENAKTEVKRKKKSTATLDEIAGDEDK